MASVGGGMVVSYTVFLAMKFLTLRSLPTESVGLFELFLINDIFTLRVAKLKA
jgi:hypothetical protein